MEDHSGSEMKKPKKRKMKTAAQLELLEKTYAVESYPSEAVRAELSEKLGLSDRQLQMWFCHRRLKDRKPNPVKKPRKDGAAALAKAEQLPALAPDNDSRSVSDSGSGSFSRGKFCRAPPIPGSSVGRIRGDVAAVGRCYETQRPVMARRAVASVEAQLGGALREDGPILGIEFDPLPPDAFGAPIGQPNQGERFYGHNIFDHSDPKSIQGSSGILHEYQFLPEQPSIRSDNYGRVTPLGYYASAVEISSAKTSLSMGHPYYHGNEQVTSGHIFHNHISSLNLPSQQVHQGHLLSPVLENDGVLRNNSFPNVSVCAPLGMQHVIAPDNQFVPFNRRVFNEDEVPRIKNRKGEEARIAKEIVAHEKRIQRELEKQELLRRKREEQMRKEMERLDRERRKEEERILREKQREVERYQREQRRELERQEKFLQRESMRVEKMRQREELRRDREAAKIKAANDRAVARRISKESTELIEDERLELMELAVLKKGLPSIVSIESETLQNLYLFRDALSAFPPKSVQLKRPFDMKPWVDSEENVGNLLMVWRFLIDFADVLGLWPFTLDEFVQALHGPEARLLSEIHTALLRCIIKDIEDVSRGPCVSLGGCQSSAANSVGGHPRIIEGAYLWGFDISGWQQNLNSLTWPEILRQLALSAGFGPKLKTRISEHPLVNDVHDVNGVASVVFDLRSGVAVENAVALMQERGYTNSRRSRHKLTPGTVKFAAFHVLSVEGSRGLTILEVADRIQKSGLRDLTTSKTPEASIAAALSRDTKLFERTAPSTYCVLSPYRKDPADADTILASARERVQVFKNGVFDGEDAYDVDKGEDSDSDTTEYPDVDDFDPAKMFDNQDVELAKMETSLDLNLASIEECGDDVEEGDLGEEWVQALACGEYSELCVEERLNAILSLVGLVLEGSSIRNVLEERLEAANALKKQMWADAQLDKRRVKEDYVTKIQHQSPAAQENPNCFDASDQCHDNEIPTEDPCSASDTRSFHKPVFCTEKLRMQLKSYISQKSEEAYVYRSLPLGQDRRRNRYWHFTTSVSPSDPGCGRIFVELGDGAWRLVDSEADLDALLGSLDTRGLRESHLYMMLQKIEGSFREAVPKCGLSSRVEDDEKHGELDTGFLNWLWREFVCLSELDVGKSSSQTCRRLLCVCQFCRCIYIFEDEHCTSCHRTYNQDDFAKHAADCERRLDRYGLDQHVWAGPVSPKINMLKALLAEVEVSVAPSALWPCWTEENRRSWGRQLYNASSPEDLLQMMTTLENAIRREFLAPSYDTVKESLNASSSSKCSQNCGTILPWVPSTTAAAALRIMEFSAAIQSAPNKELDLNESGLTKVPHGDASTDAEPAGLPDGEREVEEETWTGPRNGRGRSTRGRGRGRGRGGRYHGQSLTACTGKRRGGRQRRGRGAVRIQERPGKPVQPRTLEFEYIGEATPVAGDADTSSGMSQYDDSGRASEEDVLEAENYVEGEEMDDESMGGSGEYEDVDFGEDPGADIDVDEYVNSMSDENPDRDVPVGPFSREDLFSSSEYTE